MTVVLYSTGCPKCKVLEKKMEQKSIPFRIEDDVDLMIDKGFTSLPVLEVDGKEMDFISAVKWVDGYEQM